MPAQDNFGSPSTTLAVTLGMITCGLLATAGCEQGRTLGRVEGSVTLDGQACRGVTVVFACREERAFITANVDNDGSYVVQMAEGHGLPVGNYDVTIRAAPPETWDRPQAAVPLPPKYRDPTTSGLALQVEPGENRFDIALTSAP